MCRNLIAILLLTVVVPQAVVAKDFYVNNVAGDDRRNGLSEESNGTIGGPFRTIARALKSAEKGDRVILAATAEPYRESITLQAGRHSGTPSRPFQLIGGGAVLDGSQPVPHSAWSSVADNVFRFQPARMAFQVLFLDGVPAERVAVGSEGTLPPLDPKQWCLYDRHVYFCVEPGKLPRDYDLSHTVLPVGITLYEARHLVVDDLIVQGFQLDGVNAHDSVFDGTLVGLTCRGNGRSGISIGGASRVNVIACLVGDNGVAQVRTEGHCVVEIINSTLLEGTAAGLVREGGRVNITDTATQ